MSSSPIFSFVVANQGRSLSKTLRFQGGFSLTAVKRIKKNGKVLINGKEAGFDQLPVQGDLIQVLLPETGTDSVVPENIPLSVLFQDQHILALNKPSGMICHPTSRILTGTLANGIKHLWQSEAPERPVRLVSRLDAGTSGVILTAKSSDAHQRLASAEIQKEYLAICHGRTPESGEVSLALLRERGDACTRVSDQGKESLTWYQRIAVMKLEVSGEPQEFSLLRVGIGTGRTHQIRAHLTHLGFPLAGDDLYGGTRELIQRPALHAWKVSFMDPYSREPRLITAPLPKDMASMIIQAGLDPDSLLK